MPVLLRPQLTVKRAAIEQGRVWRNVEDLALIHDQDLVAVGQRGEPVRDDDHRPPAGDTQEIGTDDRLALRIQGAGRFIEDEDARIVDQRARDRQPLLLTAREVGRSFLDIGIVAVRHPLDELVGAGQMRGAHDVGEVEPGAAGNDVVADRSTEQEIVLQNDAEPLAQMAQVDFLEIDAVKLEEPTVVAVDPLQQPGDRRFSRAAPPDNAEHGSGRNVKADPVQRRCLGADIAEGQDR